MTTETKAPDPAPRMGAEEQRELLKRLRHYGDNDRDAAAALIEQLSTSLYKAEGRNGKLASDLASAQDCISGWVAFGSNVTDGLGLSWISPKDILAEIARLRAIPVPVGAPDLRAAAQTALEALETYVTTYNDYWERGMDILEPIGDKALATLRAALAAPAPQAPGWQPIETAPKEDGKPALLLVNGEVLPGCWCYVLFKEVRDLDGRYVGQRDEDAFWITYRDGPCEPTHYMPLPAAPQTKEPKA